MDDSSSLHPDNKTLSDYGLGKLDDKQAAVTGGAPDRRNWIGFHPLHGITPQTQSLRRPIVLAP